MQYQHRTLMMNCVLNESDKADETGSGGSQFAQFGTSPIGSYDPMLVPSAPKNFSRVKSALSATVIAFALFAALCFLSFHQNIHFELEEASLCPPNSELPPGQFSCWRCAQEHSCC